MKFLRSLFWCAFALSSVPSLAWGDEPSLSAWATRRVDEGLLKPMTQQEGNRSKFSRSRPVPREWRVRVLQETASVDKSGRAFMAFALDSRFGSEWQANNYVGCVYRGSGNIFIKSGDQYRPGQFLLGKNLAPVAGVCEAAPAKS